MTKNEKKMAEDAAATTTAVSFVNAVIIPSPEFANNYLLRLWQNARIVPPASNDKRSQNLVILTGTVLNEALTLLRQRPNSTISTLADRSMEIQSLGGDFRREMWSVEGYNHVNGEGLAQLTYQQVVCDMLLVQQQQIALLTTRLDKLWEKVDFTTTKIHDVAADDDDEDDDADDNGEDDDRFSTQANTSQCGDNFESDDPQAGQTLELEPPKNDEEYEEEETTTKPICEPTSAAALCQNAAIGRWVCGLAATAMFLGFVMFLHQQVLAGVEGNNNNN